mgnify:CR=1 FL=1
MCVLPNALVALLKEGLDVLGLPVEQALGGAAGAIVAYCVIFHVIYHLLRLIAAGGAAQGGAGCGGAPGWVESDNC